MRSSKKIMVSRDAMRDVGLLDRQLRSAAYAPDSGRKPDRGNSRSQGGMGQCSIQSLKIRAKNPIPNQLPTKLHDIPSLHPHCADHEISQAMIW